MSHISVHTQPGRGCPWESCSWHHRWMGSSWSGDLPGHAHSDRPDPAAHQQVARNRPVTFQRPCLGSHEALGDIQVEITIGASPHSMDGKTNLGAKDFEICPARRTGIGMQPEWGCQPSEGDTVMGGLETVLELGVGRCGGQWAPSSAPGHMRRGGSGSRPRQREHLLPKGFPNTLGHSRHLSYDGLRVAVVTRASRAPASTHCLKVRMPARESRITSHPSFPAPRAKGPHSTSGAGNHSHQAGPSCKPPGSWGPTQGPFPPPGSHHHVALTHGQQGRRQRCLSCPRP